MEMQLVGKSVEITCSYEHDGDQCGGKLLIYPCAVKNVKSVGIITQGAKGVILNRADRERLAEILLDHEWFGEPEFAV